MRFRLSQRGFRSAMGACFALVVVVCAWPSSACAGCSHYVVSRKQPVASQVRLDLLERAGLTFADEAPATPKPCSGALCSGSPAVPVPVPMVLAVPHADQWGQMFPFSTLETAEGRILAHSERIFRAVVEGPSIDRPPRRSDAL